MPQRPFLECYIHTCRRNLMAYVHMQNARVNVIDVLHYGKMVNPILGH